MKKRLRILNLGAGTQSSVLLLWAEAGDIPPVDAAIFADTQWEPREVYEHLDWLERQVKRTPIIRVTAGNLRDDAVEFMQHRKSADGKRWASMPLHVLNPNRTKGMLKRQCTKEYKIIPIERYIRRTMLGLPPGGRIPKDVRVEQVFGISFDERERMKVPKAKWATFDYPLVDQKIRRQQIIEWAERHCPDHPFPRSACVGCPYLSNRELRKMRDDRTEEWSDRVDFDYAIRDRDRERQRQRATVHAQPFIHRQCVPMDLANLDDDQEEIVWGMANECEGMCGV